MKIQSLGILAFCIPLAGVAWGDTLVLRNGAHMAGQFVSAQNGNIVFTIQGQRNRRFNVPAQDGYGRTNRFEHKSIYWSPQTGARVDYAR